LTSLQCNNFCSLRIKTSAEVEFPEKMGEAKLTAAENEDHEKLQVKIQAFEDKINAELNTPGSIRRYSLGQVSKEERKNIRFSRCKFCLVSFLKFVLHVCYWFCYSGVFVATQSTILSMVKYYPG
jgi:hypothetical protein